MNDMKTQISEAQYQRLVDKTVMKALNFSSAYRNAENAKDQAEVEELITIKVERDLDYQYEVI